MGMNARLDTIQAAILSKLEIFDWEIKERNRIAKFIRRIWKLFLSCIPKVRQCMGSYTLQSSKRDKIIGHLKEYNIPAMIYYPKPMHEQPAYKKFMLNKELKQSTELSKKVFSIPIHPYLKDLEVEYIVENLKKTNKLFL